MEMQGSNSINKDQSKYYIFFHIISVFTTNFGTHQTLDYYRFRHNLLRVWDKRIYSEKIYETTCLMSDKTKILCITIIFKYWPIVYNWIISPHLSFERKYHSDDSSQLFKEVNSFQSMRSPLINLSMIFYIFSTLYFLC